MAEAILASTEWGQVQSQSMAFAIACSDGPWSGRWIVRHQSQPARLIQQRLHGGSVPLPASAWRPLPHLFQLCRNLAQAEPRIRDGDAGDGHRPTFRLIEVAS